MESRRTFFELVDVPRLMTEARRLNKNVVPIPICASLINFCIKDQNDSSLEDFSSSVSKSLINFCIIVVKRFSNDPSKEINQLVSLTRYTEAKCIGQRFLLYALFFVYGNEKKNGKNYRIDNEALKLVNRYFPDFFITYIMKNIYSNPIELCHRKDSFLPLQTPTLHDLNNNRCPIPIMECLIDSSIKTSILSIQQCVENNSLFDVFSRFVYNNSDFFIGLRLLHDDLTKIKPILISFYRNDPNSFFKAFFNAYILIDYETKSAIVDIFDDKEVLDFIKGFDPINSIAHFIIDFKREIKLEKSEFELLVPCFQKIYLDSQDVYIDVLNNDTNSYFWKSILPIIMDQEYQFIPTQVLELLLKDEKSFPLYFQKHPTILFDMLNTHERSNFLKRHPQYIKERENEVISPLMLKLYENDVNDYLNELPVEKSINFILYILNFIVDNERFQIPSKEFFSAIASNIEYKKITGEFFVNNLEILNENEYWWKFLHANCDIFIYYLQSIELIDSGKCLDSFTIYISKKYQELSTNSSMLLQILEILFGDMIKILQFGNLPILVQKEVFECFSECCSTMNNLNVIAYLSRFTEYLGFCQYLDQSINDNILEFFDSHAYISILYQENLEALEFCYFNKALFSYVNYPKVLEDDPNKRIFFQYTRNYIDQLIQFSFSSKNEIFQINWVSYLVNCWNDLDELIRTDEKLRYYILVLFQNALVLPSNQFLLNINFLHYYEQLYREVTNLDFRVYNYFFTGYINCMGRLEDEQRDRIDYLRSSYISLVDDEKAKDMFN